MKPAVLVQRSFHHFPIHIFSDHTNYHTLRFARPNTIIWLVNIEHRSIRFNLKWTVATFPLFPYILRMYYHLMGQSEVRVQCQTDFLKFTIFHESLLHGFFLLLQATWKSDPSCQRASYVCIMASFFPSHLKSSPTLVQHAASSPGRLRAPTESLYCKRSLINNDACFVRRGRVGRTCNKNGLAGKSCECKDVLTRLYLHYIEVELRTERELPVLLKPKLWDPRVGRTSSELSLPSGYSDVKYYPRAFSHLPFMRSCIYLFFYQENHIKVGHPHMQAIATVKAFRKRLFDPIPKSQKSSGYISCTRKERRRISISGNILAQGGFLRLYFRLWGELVSLITVSVHEYDCRCSLHGS